jgi:hypothetical protein
MSERTNRGLSADAVVAVRKRRLGTLPFALALRCCDIGEAQDAMGNLYLTTWGLNLSDTDQEWAVRDTQFHPILMGADDGSCELILGSSRSGDALIGWLKDGLRLGENPAWEEVRDGQGG